MTKYSFIVLLVCFGFICQAQNFVLPAPAGWDQSESMIFPLDFAPGIPYAGEEHLIFSPGWGEVESEEHWSYFFLWWIKSDSKVTEESLERDLKEYYDGLVGRNITNRKIESSKVVPTIVSFMKGKGGGAPDFNGVVDMLDYHSQKPIRLSIEIHMKSCKEQGKLAVFVSVSPQTKTHVVWTKFKGIRDGFVCKK